STPSTCWSRTAVRIYCIGGHAGNRNLEPCQPTRYPHRSAKTAIVPSLRTPHAALRDHDVVKPDVLVVHRVRVALEAEIHALKLRGREPAAAEVAGARARRSGRGRAFLHVQIGELGAIE